MTNKKSIYKRVLLKLSGEVLQNSKGFGININTLERIARDIKGLTELGVQLGIVIGGGNIFRGSILTKDGIDRVISDYIGMLGTVINGLAIFDILKKLNLKSTLMSLIPINYICEVYNRNKAIKLLNNNQIIIFTAGTANPLLTTDSAACLRGIEINADILLKGTKVNGIFNTDPNDNSYATMYNQISYNEVIKKELKVMDLSAFILARDYKLPICVFNINKPNILQRIAIGKKEGTLITE